MKSSKKLLVALLVFTMLLSTVSIGFAAGFKDVADEEVAEAVERLVALKIINGYEDGTFRPANPITRAEFAKVVVTALGLGSAADYAKGASAFVDVPATHWAVGYIKVANDMGIVLGRGNGIFSPEDQVTYAEAITMVVRALGYEPKAKYIGGFPGGYLAVASELDLTEGINVVNSLAATRGDVAKILDNALEAPIMEQTNWNPNSPDWKATEKTLLQNKLGVKVIDGTVTDFDDEDMIVAMDIDAINGDEDEAEDGVEYDVAKGVSFANLKGVSVAAWLLNKEIVYFSLDSAVIYDFVEKDGSSVTLVNKDKEYTKFHPDSKAVNDGEFVKAVVNGRTLNIIEVYGSLTEGGLITAVKDNVLEYTQGAASKKLRDMEDDDRVVIINGKVAEYKDLEEDMYFDYTADVLVATDKVVKGELDRVKDDEIRVSGTYKDLAAKYYVSTDDGENFEEATATSLDDFFGEDVVAVLNLVGEVIYIKGDVDPDSTTFYGFAVAIDEFNDKIKIKRDVDGKLKDVVYDLDTDDSITPIADESGDALAALAYKFKVNADNEITAAEPVATTKGYISSFVKDGEYIAIGTARYYADDAVIYHVNGKEIELLSWADIRGTGNVPASTLELFADAVKAKAMVIVGDYALASSDDYEVALLLESVRVSKDQREFKVVTGEGESKFIAEGTPTKYEYVVYTEGDEDQTVNSYVYSAVATKAGANWKGLSGTVVKASSKYLEVGTVTYRVAADVVVYTFDEDGDYVAKDMSDIDAGDTVEFLTYKGVVKFVKYE